jgi:hypothetical protein
MAQPVQAEVVHSGPKNIVLTPSGYLPVYYYFDLNGDMVEDFELGLLCDEAMKSGALFGNYYYYNAAIAYNFKYLSRVCSEEVSEDSNWSPFMTKTHYSLYVPDYYDYHYGQFWGTKGSIGVRFGVPVEGGETETHYGYIRIRVNAEGDRMEILDWAYESVPDKPIMTPPCSISAAEPTSVPTLNPWGVLILMGLILLEGGGRLNKDNGNKPDGRIRSIK